MNVEILKKLHEQAMPTPWVWVCHTRRTIHIGQGGHGAAYEIRPINLSTQDITVIADMQLITYLRNHVEEIIALLEVRK